MTAWQDLLVTQNILRAGSSIQIDFYLHKAELGKLAYLQKVYDQFKNTKYMCVFKASKGVNFKETCLEFHDNVHQLIEKHQHANLQICPAQAQSYLDVILLGGWRGRSASINFPQD